MNLEQKILEKFLTHLHSYRALKNKLEIAKEIMISAEFNEYDAYQNYIISPHPDYEENDLVSPEKWTYFQVSFFYEKGYVSYPELSHAEITVRVKDKNTIEVEAGEDCWREVKIISSYKGSTPILVYRTQYLWMAYFNSIFSETKIELEMRKKYNKIIEKIG